jgi:hypothetical protein
LLFGATGLKALLRVLGSFAVGCMGPVDVDREKRFVGDHFEKKLDMPDFCWVGVGIAGMAIALEVSTLVNLISPGLGPPKKVEGCWATAGAVNATPTNSTAIQSDLRSISLLPPWDLPMAHACLRKRAEQ